MIGGNPIGFGKGANTFTIHAMNNTTINAIKNSKSITGQYRIFNNTYEELVRSNYFSNL